MKPRGFTLVELLVVLALVGLLLTIAVPRLYGTTEKAKARVQRQNLATLRDALDKFRADQGRFPRELVELVQRGYLWAIPTDPVSGSAAWKPMTSDATDPGISDVTAPDASEPAGPAPTP